MGPADSLGTLTWKTRNETGLPNKETLMSKPWRSVLFVLMLAAFVFVGSTYLMMY